MTSQPTNPAQRLPQCVCVLGLARSGLGAARLLVGRGVRVRALDLAPGDEAIARLRDLPGDRLELIAGPHPTAALDGCGALVRSPGVPDATPLLLEARRRAIPVISEIELAARFARGALLAVTGTNGKTTTTAWTAHLLQRAGRRAIACGNIGHALSEAVLDEPPGTILVAEVSSFQLQDSPTFHPAAATILNITPDHLDRHGALETYIGAKWAIARNQTRSDRLVLGPGVGIPAGAQPQAQIVRFDLRDPGGAEALFTRDDALIRRTGGREDALFATAELALPGPHNVLNAMAAFALAVVCEPDALRLLPGLREFAGLPHRLETVALVRGVRWVNDSKATNVDSMRVALESYKGPLVLIAGGRDKAGPFEEVAALAAARVSHLIAIGEAAQRIRDAWPAVRSESAADLAAAVARAETLAVAGGVVLLSPGCASFDMFRNYADRGDRFRTLVRERVAPAAPREA
jgi:UDP-N-acetylmuramoylalanine--D-glutamate ligase